MFVRRLAVVAGFAALCAACSAGPSLAPAPALPLEFSAAAKVQTVYWTLFTGTPKPQIEYASLPLSGKTAVHRIMGTPANLLQYASALHFDANGRLWVLNEPANGNCATYALVFKLPLTQQSVPLYDFPLGGTCDADHLTFDKAGNLWVSSHQNSAVLEYKGPFTTSASLTPALTLTAGIDDPSGIAMGYNGTLYVADISSKGKNSVALFPHPVAGAQPGFLNGLAAPGGLAFDTAGNLYASQNDGKPTELARYDAKRIKSTAEPSVRDAKGDYSGGYESDFAFDSAGNLYDADCGSRAGLYVYPDVAKRFSRTLRTSVVFTEPNTTKAGCAWGIAIK